MNRVTRWAERKITPARVKRIIGQRFNQRLFDWQIDSMDRRNMPYSDSKEWLSFANSRVGDRVVVRTPANVGWRPGTVQRVGSTIRVKLDNGEHVAWVPGDGNVVARHLPFMEDVLDPVEIQHKVWEAKTVVVEQELEIDEGSWDEEPESELPDHDERIVAMYEWKGYGQAENPNLTFEEWYKIWSGPEGNDSVFEDWAKADDPEAYEPYLVAWPLTDGRVFRMPVVAYSPEDAAEQLFTVCNGQGEGPDAERWEEMQHRSLSTGDQIVVDGTPMYCDSVGWRVADEHDTVSMEELLTQTAFPNQGVHRAPEGRGL